MISLRRLVSLAALLAGVQLALAQTQPSLTQAIPARSFIFGAAAASIDLRSHFGLGDVTGTVVQFDTVLGKYNIELFDDTPLTKANFLAYIEAGQYNNTIIHRSIKDFVIQGGGFVSSIPIGEVQTRAPVRNEYRRSNLRGTLAMAKQANNPDSATSQWFVNLANNSANLDNQNGGFTVFARVLGNGMNVVDGIANVPTYNLDNGRYTDFPLRNIQSGQSQILVANFITVNTVRVISIHPTGSGVSVLAFAAESSNPNVAGVLVNGSSLSIVPGATGTATVTVRATDTHGATVETSFDVTVAASVIINRHPQSQHVPLGGAVTLNVGAESGGAISYQWLKDGTPIAGATSATYTIPGAAADTAGFYAARVTSGDTTLTSSYAIVTVAVPGTSRLINVSTRGTATGGAPLTPGFVLRGSGAKNLVVRAVGPGLSTFGVPGVLSDPKMDLIAAGQSTAVVSNDDWGSGSAQQVAELTARSGAVGAFALQPGSKDAAALAALPASGTGSGYTVSISPSGSTAGGVTLAEVYDADALTSPSRLVNVSTLGSVTSDGLTPGFVIGGTAPKQLLIRVVGPGLGAFNVPDTLSDPTLTIIPLGKSYSIATNNDWAESNRAALEAAFAASGAFALTAGSKDAAVLVRLPPGGYTAVATGVGGATGRALVEVYDLDP